LIEDIREDMESVLDINESLTQNVSPTLFDEDALLLS